MSKDRDSLEKAIRAAADGIDKSVSPPSEYIKAVAIAVGDVLIGAVTSRREFEATRHPDGTLSYRETK